MTKPLWAPWRLEYVQQAHELAECVFCAEAAEGIPAETSLLIHRGQKAFVLLNKFPYSSGHLMTAPVRHVDELGELDDEEVLELHLLVVAGMSALERTYDPDGFNLGWNLGHIAGAGIADHVHIHIVPRWSGDTNFMPVLADVKVLPEHLLATRDRLREAWTQRPTGSAS
jgi:ATP adenylyltransferase